MRILKSKNNRSRYRNRLGQQLVAVLFTLGLAGSPFGQTAIGEPWNDSTRLPNPAARAPNPGAAATTPAATATPVATAATPPSGGGGGDPGCIKTFEELGKSCAGAMASNDVASQAGVAAATQAGPCRAGMTYVPSKNSQDNPSCVPSINTAAGQQEKSATIAQGANANVSAACTETLRRCEEACGQAIKIHRANASASASNPTIANKEINYSHIAEKNLESCKKDMGMVATETGISATTLGLAAAAAGGIFLLTKVEKERRFLR
ncbi:MAG: hypothetical protein IPK68_11825 [Bdellovibrionales bacterium]|nr:hypothetical protein [Bdellovibrionales bacterium]